MRRLGCVLLAAVVAGACGKKANGPAGPSNTTTTTAPPSPTVLSLSVAEPPDLLFINATQPLTATATLSNGTTAAVSPRWTVDPSSVGAVVGGVFSALAAGEAVITAEHEGARASVRTRVVPNVGGIWDAVFRITVCTATLDFRSGCDDEELNKLYSFGFDLIQARDSVTGRLDVFSDLSIPGSGSIGLDGQLAMTGFTTFTSSNVLFEYRVENWKSTTPNNVTMTGTFDVVIRAPKYQGEVRWNCEMPSASKTVNRALTTEAGGPAGRLRPPIRMTR